MLVNPDRLQAVQLLATSADQRGQVREDFHRLQQAFLPDTRLSYWRDIQPWLDDEITVAITTSDIDRDLSNGAQVGYLVAMTAKDSDLARRTLRSFWKRHTRAKDLVSESYAGVQIVYRHTLEKARQRQAALETETDTDPPPILTLASAVVGDRFVLLSNSPKVLRDALNNVQVAELGLVNSSAYQQALAHVPKQAIALTLINLPQLSTWVMGQPEPLLSHPYESLLSTWSIDSLRDGLRDGSRDSLVTDTLLLAAEEQPPVQPQLSEPVGALRFIPAHSSLTLAGIDLSQRWQQLETNWASYEIGWGAVQRSLATFEQAQHISLSEDVFSWITGEYALGMLPRTDRVQPDWVLVAQRSPQTAAGLEKLDAIAQSHNVMLGALTLDTPTGSQAIYVWTKFSTKVSQPSQNSKARSMPSSVALEAKVEGVRATVGDYEILRHLWKQ
ncbi:MAG: DUF3352 domain-containing protein [Leptolyngbyaceae cyanobacterium CRU_2_3]|nr:DUF3352 domain-containing protein [Leptolyngbyaceae cyanobacterium CRU_2_3]